MVFIIVKGVTKSPVESDELEYCVDDEERADNLSSATLQRSVLLGHEWRRKPRLAGGAQQAEDYV